MPAPQLQQSSVTVCDVEWQAGEPLSIYINEITGLTCRCCCSTCPAGKRLLQGPMQGKAQKQSKKQTHQLSNTHHEANNNFTARPCEDVFRQIIMGSGMPHCWAAIFKIRAAALIQCLIQIQQAIVSLWLHAISEEHWWPRCAAANAATHVCTVPYCNDRYSCINIIATICTSATTPHHKRVVWTWCQPKLISLL